VSPRAQRRSLEPADNGTAFLLPPHTTSSHGTQTPEASPIDTMPPQLASQLPDVATTEKNGAPALHRKQSSPMMPPFMVSAPGKVIVYGEHAVVHGKVCSMRHTFSRHY
jgi:mevalonate kinase